MKKILCGVVLLLSGCFPQLNERKVAVLIDDLQHAHQWDPQRGANECDAYLHLLRMGPEALPSLAMAFLDERPTQIMDLYPAKVPTVGDLAFLTALKIAGERMEDYADVGVMRGRDRNPLFALEFTEGARARARDKLLRRLEEEDK